LKPALHVIRDCAGAAENERGIFFLHLAQLSVLAFCFFFFFFFFFLLLYIVLSDADTIYRPGLEERCRGRETREFVADAGADARFGGDIDFTPGRLGSGTRDASLHALFEQWRSVQRREHIWRQQNSNLHEETIHK
jgi:hypothetical protein